MATATETKTLLEFLMDLLSDKEALANFQDDPECALKDAGLEGVSLDDIQDVLPHVLEKIDPEACARYEDDCDEDKCHDDKAREHGEHHHPGKHHDECDDDRGSHHGDDHGHEISQVISHLTYVTNNYSYTDNSTDFHNNIWTDGDVTLNQAGAGGIAFDGDNNGVANTGDGAVIGDDNQVSGAGSTTSFGGDANSFEDFGVGDGSSFIVGDDNTAAIDNSDNSTNDSGNLDNVGNDNSDNSDNSETIVKTDNSQDNDLEIDNSQDNDTIDSNNGNSSDDDGLDIDTGDIDVDIAPIGALPIEA